MSTLITRESFSDLPSRIHVGTHDGIFHADEVFAIAAISLASYGTLVVHRSRDSKVWNEMDCLVDVGGVYDEHTNRFDHHQRDFKEVRENGVPYASFGLVWRSIKKDLPISDFVWKSIDETIVQPIDGADCGHPTYQGNAYTVSAIISEMNPTWTDDFDAVIADNFKEAVDLAVDILGRAINRFASSEQAVEYVTNALETRDIPEILVLDKFCPWQDVVCEDAEVKYVVFPSPELDWRVHCVPLSPGSFNVRQLLPMEWRGLSGVELSEICGVEDAVFCHRAGFIGGSKSKASAIRMASLSLSQPQSNR